MMRADELHLTTTEPTPVPDTYAAIDPARPAYVMAGTGRTVTYGELVGASKGIAALLWGRGLRHGDCVAILMENAEALLEVAWAAQRIGLRYVGLATRMQPAEVAYILNDSGAKALFTSPALLATAASAVAEAPDVQWRFTTGFDAAGFEALDAAIEGAPPVTPEEREGIDLLYSSGTTGRPKGVVAALPLAPLGTPPAVASLLHDRWGFDDRTVYLSPAPLYHAAPLRFCMAVHRYGGTVIVMERFDAEWVESAGTGTLSVVDPATEEPIATVPRGHVADVDRAAQAAARAFESWSQTSHEQRAAVLVRIADILEAQAEGLARSTTREIGTPIALARSSHVATPINDLRIAAAAIKDILWEECFDDTIVRRIPAVWPVRSPRGTAPCA